MKVLDCSTTILCLQWSYKMSKEMRKDDGGESLGE